MICTKCQSDKLQTEFYFRKDSGRYRSECKMCWNDRVEQWQNKNRDKVRSYVRKSCKTAYDADPEKFKLKSRKDRAKNPEKKRVIVNRCYAKIYKTRYASERARLNASSAARRRAAPSWLTAIQKAQIQEMYDVAIARTQQTGIKHHVDHIMPILGELSSGLHVPWNLQILTASENCAKKNRVEA